MERKTCSWGRVLAQRSAVYGFAALMILFYHLNRYAGGFGGIAGALISAVLDKGNMGVDIFIFFSSVSLCRSMARNKLSVYYQNRIKHLFVPFLLCTILYFIWMDFFALRDGVGQFLLNITTVNFWLTGRQVYSFWYVPCIALLYAVFPLCYHADRKTRHWSSWIVILAVLALECLLYKLARPVYNMFEIFLSRIPAFMLGLILAPWIYGEKNAISKPVLLIALLYAAAAMAAVTVLHGLPSFVERYILSAAGICVAVLFALLVDAAGRKGVGVEHFFAFCGAMSLEIYCIHEGIIRVLDYYAVWAKLPTAVWYGLIFAVSLLLSWLASRAAKALTQSASR